MGSDLGCWITIRRERQRGGEEREGGEVNRFVCQHYTGIEGLRRGWGGGVVILLAHIMATVTTTLLLLSPAGAAAFSIQIPFRGNNGRLSGRGWGGDRGGHLAGASRGDGE